LPGALAALACWARGGPALANQPETVARGLVNPWALAFLPDGRMLVTERPAACAWSAPTARLSPPLPGLPAVAAEGQGGLLDVVTDPRFASNRLVYWSYSRDRGRRGRQRGTVGARRGWTASAWPRCR
jgi:glucose/arabinose dehydrogenase